LCRSEPLPPIENHLFLAFLRIEIQALTVAENTGKIAAMEAHSESREKISVLAILGGIAREDIQFISEVGG